MNKFKEVMGNVFTFIFLKEMTCILNRYNRFFFGAWNFPPKKLITSPHNWVFVGKHDQGRLVPIVQNLPGLQHFSHTRVGGFSGTSKGQAFAPVLYLFAGKGAL